MSSKFSSLDNFAKKDLYFYRVATWDWLSAEDIHIFDPHGPRVITVDEWTKIVFLEALGKYTVSGFIDYMASLYENNVPEGLDQTIIDQLNSFEDLKLIEYSDSPVVLKVLYDQPLSEQKN